mgnify:CR=1 FL=1
MNRVIIFFRKEQFITIFITIYSATIFIPLMYPEAFLTGAVISIFVIYKPHWISTFDDRRYLHRR